MKMRMFWAALLLDLITKNLARNFPVFEESEEIGLLAQISKIPTQHPIIDWVP
jgi:hypothetical protein